MTGTVSAFDEQSGLGVVVAGGMEFPFHCTQIADGTRVIAAGSQVDFDVVAARHGRREAARIRPF